MSGDNADLLVFTDDVAAMGAAPPGAAEEATCSPWRILIVDDDEDVHNATEFALAGLKILERPLEFLHAYSATDAIDLLMHEQNVAVILLDVVMEREDAGLAAVTTIRRDLGLGNVQIILRTGQPGYAPEIETIRRYEINDYRTKSELSRVKMYTAITSAVRAYDQLQRIDADRHALELVVDAANRLLATTEPDVFAKVLLERCAAIMDLPGQAALFLRQADGAYAVVDVAGELPVTVGTRLDESAQAKTSILQLVNAALQGERTQIAAHGTALYFGALRNAPFVVYVATPSPAHISRQMLEVFCGNVAVCSENVNLVNRLSDMAFTDGLTGLASRRAFAAELDRRLDAVNRNETAVMLIDIDQFAETNDMFGHHYGDDLLCALADRLRHAMPEDVLISRLSGDTFALLGHPSQLDHGMVRSTLSKPYAIDGEDRLVSVSTSLVLAQDTTGDAHDLIKDATITIKRAKASGLGRHAGYSAEFGEAARSRSRLLHDLGNAFRRTELFLVYQPQISLVDGRAVGVEALIRWRNSDGSMIPPDRFIPLAENSGLIIPIGHWVLKTALATCAQLKAEGFPLRMAVNISPPQFQQTDLPQRVLAALNEVGLDAEHLELEVTEGVSIIGFEQALMQIEALRTIGVAIAIDDFGTGYSSLSYLDRLPADRLKIDRAFVTPLGQEKAGPRIAEMVLTLGRQLKLSVLAEGVETEQQAEILRNLGCDEAQGYLYARPMPLPELRAWLQSRPR